MIIIQNSIRDIAAPKTETGDGRHEKRNTTILRMWSHVRPVASSFGPLPLTVSTPTESAINFPAQP